MTVEAYLRSLVIGLEFTTPVLERCARSPKEVDLDPLNLTDDIDPTDETVDLDDLQARLDYASSTLYYSLLGVFSGGGYSEQVGDVRISKNNFTITQSDRERYKALADALREKWDFDVEDVEVTSDDSGMFDASDLRRRPNYRPWPTNPWLL